MPKNMSKKEAREMLRLLRAILETRSTAEVATACQVDVRTVRNWRKGRLPNSPAILANLTAYMTTTELEEPKGADGYRLARLVLVPRKEKR